MNKCIRGGVLFENKNIKLYQKKSGDIKYFI